MKNYLLFLLVLMPFILVSCGDEEPKEPNEPITPSQDQSTYLATSDVKTVTLTSVSYDKLDSNEIVNGEYLLYKDYYWKHTLSLHDSELCSRSYSGGGNGWNIRLPYMHINVWEYKFSCFYDAGQIAKLSEIKAPSCGFDGYYNVIYYRKPYSSEKSYLNQSIQFKPGHGYVLAFVTGESYELKYIAIFPVSFTMDDSDVITSIKVQYVLL